ncbi:MAG TPA: two-component system response regulator KdpE [Rhodocyclaceae bacterium]|nr:two-component system response regulator KdpE [Rhodocyclaceae bacterium]
MSIDAARILIVEDEPQIRRLVHQALTTEGWQVIETATGQDGLLQAGTATPDLLILDLGLPDMDGVDLIRDLRNWSELPVLILSARGAELDKIAALDAGADDYLTKPFGIGELLARVRALLRRRSPATEAAATICFGDVEVDFVRRRVTRDGGDVHLTPIEYRLLTLLIANAGKVMTHRHLLREVWGPTFSQSSHYLRVYVGHLRRKLESDPAQPQHLLTETGVGYRFDAEGTTTETP